MLHCARKRLGTSLSVPSKDMAGRLFALFIFCLFLTTVISDYSCPVAQDPYAFCSTTTLYALDLSVDLNPSQVEAEFSWIRNSILPRTDWSHKYASVAFFSFGSMWSEDYIPTKYYSNACTELSSAQLFYENHGSKEASLYDAMVTIVKQYGSSLTDIVLFSGSKDTADIQSAGMYATRYMKTTFTVIALNGALFDGINFPGTVYHVNDLNNPPDNLAWCVLWKTCGTDPMCNIDETVGGRQTTHQPSFPTTGPPSTLQCQCDTMSAWVDMIFVLDASASTGSAGLNEMWGTAGTILELFNVQKTGYTATNYTSRVGIITYGNTSNVLYPLGSLDNDMIDHLLDLPFNNDPKANLEAGIMAAVAEFNGPNHRSNAREVIIVMAAAFNPEGQNAPNKTAQTFKEDDGILVVYNYVPAHGIESPLLESISSPGYFFSTTLDSQTTDMALALCDANCFCRDDMTPFGLSSPRQYPTKGCYNGIPTGTNYARASNNCKMYYNNGVVATDKDGDKTAFLEALLPSSHTFYIGLTYDNMERNWLWPDGTTLGSYQPWVGGKVPDGTTGQCTFVDSNSQWQPTDCRNGYYYICEVMPCDSKHYCG